RGAADHGRGAAGDLLRRPEGDDRDVDARQKRHAGVAGAAAAVERRHAGRGKRVRLAITPSGRATENTAMVRVLPFFVRRILLAAALVLVVSSTALLSVRLAPGDHIASFDVDPRVVEAERHRLGLDRPLLVQYADWLSRAVRLDLGESLKYRR